MGSNLWRNSLARRRSIGRKAILETLENGHLLASVASEFGGAVYGPLQESQNEAGPLTLAEHIEQQALIYGQSTNSGNSEPDANGGNLFGEPDIGADPDVPDYPICNDTPNAVCYYPDEGDDDPDVPDLGGGGPSSPGGNDLTNYQLYLTSYNAEEGGAVGGIVISRAGSANSSLSFQYLLGQNASAGPNDYLITDSRSGLQVPHSGWLTFATEEFTITLDVNAFDDFESEYDEAIDFEIVDTGGYTATP